MQTGNKGAYQGRARATIHVPTENLNRDTCSSFLVPVGWEDFVHDSDNNDNNSDEGRVAPLRFQLHGSTSTLSQRKGRAPQPSVTWGGVSQPGGGVLHDNNSDMTP